MKRRGAILLELTVALTIFVAAALAMLSLVRQGVKGHLATLDMLKAADLARSALAKLQAGNATVQELDGHVAEWVDEQVSEQLSDAPPEPSDWYLEIETDRSGFGQLTIVHIRAYRDIPGGASFSLTELIPMEELEDLLPPEDEDFVVSDGRGRFR